MRSPLLQISEEAISRISHAYLEELSVADDLIEGFGRIDSESAYSGPSPDEQAIMRAHYFRIVSLIEAYVDTMASNLWQSERLARDKLFELLALPAEEKAESSWTNRKHALSQYLRVPIGEAGRYESIMAAVTVRNSIAHGLGQMTRRQRNPSDRRRVRSAGVQIVDNWVIVSSRSLILLRANAIKFIREVDDLVQTRAPF